MSNHSSSPARIVPAGIMVAATIVAATCFLTRSINAADRPMPTSTSTKTTSREATSKTMPPPTAAGHQTGLIPREVLFGNPDKAAARMSHDGKWLSYLAPVDGVLNIWVAPIDKPAEAKPVTKEKDRPIQAYFWAYTNKHLLYSQDVKGDENYHIYAVDLTSGEIKDLTPRAEGKEVRAEIEEVSYKFPHEILIGLNDRDPQFHDIYRMNIETGEKKLLQKNEEFAGFVTDEDYRVRFAQKFAPNGSAVILKPDGKQGWTEFLTIPQADTLTTGLRGFDKTGDIPTSSIAAAETPARSRRSISSRACKK
jgi:hypothetical protein